MTPFNANMLPALIGSLPISDHDQAVRMVMEYTPEIPLWVQLPVFPQEGMMMQFTPGIPGTVDKNGRLFVDTAQPAFENDLMAFYEEFLEVTEGGGPLEGTRFALTPDMAPGFFTFLEAIKSAPALPKALKGQITGPVTLATGLTDQDGRALFYDHRVLDAVVKLLALKARYQVERFLALGLPAIVFIDEPALAGFGSSAFVGISAADVDRVLSEVIAAIHGAGGLAGVHVCANTDWSLILDSSADILSFDAYGYFDRLCLYEKSLKKFLADGHTVAWGIVPTSNTQALDEVSINGLVDMLVAHMARVQAMGVDPARLQAQSLITPSCGTGSLPSAYAKQVLEITRKVSEALRAESFVPA